VIKSKTTKITSKFLKILVAASMVVYVLTPINFASGVGQVSWRSIAESSSANGFTPTTLNGAINSVVTSMVVTSSANYPSTPFIVTIGSVGSEAIEVTAVSGNTWTIVRGYGGTTALSYLNSATVSGPVTANFEFTPATPATSIQAIVVDFCTDSPIYNASTCFTPTGMLIGASGGSSLAFGTSGTGFPPTGISASLFNLTYSRANNTSRNDILIGNNGTGYVPSSAGALSAAITLVGATSISVSGYAAYPVAVSTNPNTWFYITIPSSGETMQVTSTGGGTGTWTVVRGALGTTAATASNLSPLSQPPINFTVYGLMNPTSAGSLYARIYTFSTYSTASTFAAATSSSGVLSSTYATASGANIDAGGVALDITTALSIAFKVQEYIEFCLYTASGSSTGCNLSGSSVTLGNASGVLSLSNAYVDSSTRFDVATNASGYVAITFTGAPPSNGGSVIVESSTLSGTGSVAATNYQSTVGHTQFGLCAAVAGVAYQASGYSLTNLSFPNSTYAGGGACPTVEATSATYSGAGYFGFNIAQIGSVYGDLLATQLPGAVTTGLLSFLGNVSPAIPSGAYSTTLYFTATGTY